MSLHCASMFIYSVHCSVAQFREYSMLYCWNRIYFTSNFLFIYFKIFSLVQRTSENLKKNPPDSQVKQILYPTIKQ